MFSIIVSIYKVEKYLRECIESILGQTYTDFELILVDDGSPDACPQICDEYAEKDSRVKVIHKENGGLMSTRKVGVAASTGRYVCFVDGDDFVQKDMLETYFKTLSEREADVICGGFSTYCDGRSEVLTQMIPAGFYDRESLVNDVHPKMLSTEPFYSFYVIPSVCTKCFKKEIVEKVYADIPEDISIGEDASASYPALLCAQSISVIDYYGYMYRQNQSSMTHTYNKNLYKKMKSLITHLKKQKEIYRWNDKNQIDEYSVFLLYLAKTNEIIYNSQEPYRVRKKNLNVYLNDEDFKQSVRKMQMKGLRNKFIVWCFKNKIVLPLYLLSKKK